MTWRDNSMESLLAEAERLGKEQAELDERNRKRRAKGRKPLPDIQEQKDMEILRRKYRTGDDTTVDGDDALKLYMMRKSAMQDGADDPDDVYDEENGDGVGPLAQENDASVGAVTSNAAKPSGKSVWSFDAEGKQSETPVNTKYDAPAPAKKAEKSTKIATAQLAEFRKDVYERMGASFSALEKSISDLAAKVDAIVPAKDEKPQVGADEFDALLAQKTPVVFDVGGTKLTFDAVCVFHASPCITVVSKIGSAKITPKPGASLLLSYDMDGVHYDDDPVTYLGTRFDLPMFGLSFVGFIRDAEAGVIDAEAGVAQQTQDSCQPLSDSSVSDMKTPPPQHSWEKVEATHKS